MALTDRAALRRLTERDALRRLTPPAPIRPRRQSRLAQGVPGRPQPPLATPSGKRPQVVAHRGASDVAPEHTLAAYRLALDAGAEALECDVRLTADGVLVCVHDRLVDRTSSGRGPVSTLELADLAELDFGSWKGIWTDHVAAGVVDELGATAPLHQESPQRDGFGVLTLDALLRLVADYDRPVELAIETKHPTRYAGLVERRLVETLDRYGLAHPTLGQRSPVRIMSFSPVSLRRMRLLAPSVPTVLLMTRVPLRLRDGHLPTGIRIAGPSMRVVRAHPEFVAKVHRHGGLVHVWTVDNPADVDLCASLGVDAIITNRPARVLARMGAR